MITRGRKWVTASELSGGRSGRYETQLLLPTRMFARMPLWMSERMPAGVQRWVHLPVPSRIITGRVRGFCRSEGVIGFLFHSQDSFYVIPHRLGDQSCIDETQDCRRETQDLLDHMWEGKARLFCSSAATCLPYPHPRMWAASCPSLTLHYLLWPFLPFPEKGILEMVGFAASNYLA